MHPGQKLSSSERQSFVQAIDGLFLKLELSYHYQFYKVFGTDARLKEAKRIWAESLKKFSAASIDLASEAVIQASDYLPTLTEIIKACKDTMSYGDIPSTQEAFLEAQKSSSPRKEYPWSHPIIYWAAKEVGWDSVNSSHSPHAFKLFADAYLRMAKDLKKGKSFDIEPTAQQEDGMGAQDLDLELLKKLRKEHGI